MPRSSRSKSHKQSKHSSKDAAAAREYSGSDEDVKIKDRSNNGGREDGTSVRISKDSTVAGEKRKHGKDLSGSHGNGEVLEEYTTSSKRREEKSHGGSDRWNGGSSEEKGAVVNIDNKELKSKDCSRVVGESKSKSSRRHDAESPSAVTIEKEEGKSGSGSRGEKRKSEKESVRKENSQYKENKESKDKDRGSDRGRKSHADKLEVEPSSKQGEHQSSKRGKETTEWPIEEELRNPELEKELEKRIRRRGEGFGDKDKYQDDVKEGEDRRLRAKDERHKDEGYGDTYREEGVRETKAREDKYREDGERDRKGRDVKQRGESERFSKHRDEKHREDGERDRHREDKYREDGEREGKRRDEKYTEGGDREERIRDSKRKQDDEKDYRHKEEKHREDADRDHRHRDGRHRDDTDREKRARDSKYRDSHTSRDHAIESEAKRPRDDSIASDLYHRKASNRDGSPAYDDRVSRYKDDKDRRRGNDKDDPSDYRSHSVKEQRSESEKRSSSKVDSVPERGRTSSRYVDVEISGSHGRRRSSPGGSSHPARDHYRAPKQEESKYRDHAYEERARHSVHSTRDFTSAPGQSDKLPSRSLEKVAPKDDNYTTDSSRPQVDKSPSSTSNERRNLNRSDVRRSLDVEEPGHRSGGSKEAKEHTPKDIKGNRESSVIDAHHDNDFSQVDGDNMSVSSPYTRSSHFSEDDRNKSNNRHRRMGDPNMGRAQGSWKNVPTWPSPMAATGGYIPFQHVPPPIFHPVMQQFPPPIFGRPPMKLNPGLPYHVPWRNQVDESVPPPLHGWDANNAVFGDESHLYGRIDWDRRTQLSNRGWDSSADMWKSQNAEPSASAQGPNDEIWSGQMGQLGESEPTQLDIIQAATMNGGESLERNPPEAPKLIESPHEAAKKDETHVSQVYLSKVDISQDLTQPQLYDQCTSMMDFDQESSSDEFDCKILFLEEGVEANVTDSSLLFAAINDSVFEKAMFLYKKQKQEFRSTNEFKVSRHVTNSPTFVEVVDQEKDGLENNGKPTEKEAAESPLLEVSNENNELPAQKLDTEPVNEATVTDEPEPTKPDEHADMEVDYPVVKQETEPNLILEEKPPSNDECGGGGGGDGGSGGGGSVVVLSDGMATESIESGSVNLSRIHHHSPESTH